MLDNTTIIKVKNRNNGKIGYSIPDSSFHRFFEPGEIKEVTFGELKGISYSRGGRYILEHYLLINNEEAVAELLGNIEPEYFYSEEIVEKILKTGTLDELLDCLDFAPAGVISMIKQKAVELKINDMNKRKAIEEKTGLNVSAAIENREEAEEEVVETPKRRSAPVTADKEPTKKRRTTKPKELLVEEAIVD